jgi:hypothetical protein
MKLLDRILINNLAGNVTIHTELVYRKRDGIHDEAIYEITIRKLTKEEYNPKKVYIKGQPPGVAPVANPEDVNLIDGDQFSFPTMITEHVGRMNGEPFFRPTLDKEYNAEYTISLNNGQDIVLSEDKAIKDNVHDKEIEEIKKKTKKRK